MTETKTSGSLTGKRRSPSPAPAGASRSQAKTNARHRLDIDAEDSARLERLSETFQAPRSEVVRRLIRAAAECGPALSKEGAATIAALAREARGIELRLRQLVAAGRTQGGAGAVGLVGVAWAEGAADDLASSAPSEDFAVIAARLVEAYAAMNRELNEITLRYGSRLRSLLGRGEGGR